MRIIVVSSAEDIGGQGASEVEAALASTPSPILGVATGSTPLPVYEALARRRSISAEEVTAFGLDEYVGFSPNHPQSYHAFIAEHVTAPFGLDPCRVHLPDGTADDPAAEAARYERAIHEAGGATIQILGIGSNGHIGFNEPPSPLASRTRVVSLASQTRRDNARFFDDVKDVPTEAITQGIGTILTSRRLLLLAIGIEKADALVHALEGPVTPSCPASAVQLHADVVVIADSAAASRLVLTKRCESLRYA